MYLQIVKEQAANMQHELYAALKHACVQLQY